MLNEQPKTLAEAVDICLLTLTVQEKEAVKSMSEGNLIMLHLSMGKSIRDKFDLWEGNKELIQSCGVENPDDASMVIGREVWETLNQPP